MGYTGFAGFEEPADAARLVAWINRLRRLKSHAATVRATVDFGPDCLCFGNPRGRPALRSPRMAQTHHNGFRRFRRAVTDGNDALIGLVVASRLALHHFGRRPRRDRDKWLPDLYPSVDEVSRLNLQLDRAKAAIGDSECYLAYMAIPFAVTAYNELLVEVAELLVEDGHAATPRPPGEMMLGQLRTYIAGCGVALPAHPEEMFNLTYFLRNRIIHYAAVEGPAGVTAWNKLTPMQKALWKRVAGRGLPVGYPDQRLDLRAGEARAAFATVRRIGEAMNEALVPLLSRACWALLAARDFRDSHPDYTNRGDIGGTLSAVHKYASQLYGPVGLTRRELETAIRQVPWR
jgi:hypothetical protein